MRGSDRSGECVDADSPNQQRGVAGTQEEREHLHWPDGRKLEETMNDKDKLRTARVELMKFAEIIKTDAEKEIVLCERIAELEDQVIELEQERREK